MEIRELERTDLLKMYYLCQPGESWAEENYKVRKENYNKDIHIYGVWLEDKLVASITVYESRGDDGLAIKGECIHITSLRVLRDYRQRGYAKSLLKYVLYQYKKKGYKNATASVDIDNEIGKHIVSKFNFHKIYKDMRGFIVFKRLL